MNKKVFLFTVSFIISLCITISFTISFNITKYFIPAPLVIVFFTIYKILNKNLNLDKKNIYILVFSLVISSLIVISYSTCFVYENEYVTIIPEKSATNKKTKEVWLCDLNNDVIIESNEEWIPIDNCLVYNGVNESEIRLGKRSDKPLFLKFISHNYSGGVKIKYNDNSTYFDLYDEKSKIVETNVALNKTVDLSKTELITSFLWFISIFSIIYITYLADKKASIYLSYSLIYQVTFYLLSISKIVSAGLYILTIPLVYISIKRGKTLIKSFNRLDKILFILFSIVINFLIWGSPIFMWSDSIAFNINIINISLFLLTLLMTGIINFSIISIFNYVQHNLFNDKKNYKYIYFICSFLVLTAWSIAYYPGNLSSDSVSQIYQAINGPIEDAHPAIMTIILGIIYKIFYNPYYYILLQNIFFSFTLNKIFSYLNKKGFNHYILIILSFLIPLLPNIGINNTTIWKDIIYSISLLLLSYYTYRIVVNDDKDIYNIKDEIFFVVSIVFVKEFRHNGLVPFILVTILLLILSYKRKNKKLMIITLASVLLSTLGIKLLYKHYNVVHNNLSGSVYNSVVKNFAATLYYNKELPADAYNLIDSIGDKEYFSSVYNPTNIDYFFYNDPTSYSKWFNTVNNYNAIKVLPVYLHNIIKHPDIFVRDKYDSMAIMIDASMKNNYKEIMAYHDGIYKFNEESAQLNVLKDLVDLGENGYYADNKLTKVTRSYINATLSNEMTMQLCWKSGIYFILYLLLFFYLIYERKANIILGMMPVIGNTLSWFLVLNHPSVRYVYYLNMSFIFMLLLVLIPKKKEDNNG